jgi:peptidoglycan/xylan/chitin deacetylase (PgdA/CDA1 family)
MNQTLRRIRQGSGRNPARRAKPIHVVGHAARSRRFARVMELDPVQQVDRVPGSTLQIVHDPLERLLFMDHPLAHSAAKCAIWSEGSNLIPYQALASWPFGHAWRDEMWESRPLRLGRIMMLLRAAVVALFVLTTAAAQAADCPRQGVLGTSRVLTVDAAAFPRVGLKSFAQTLPLADKEVVLTFDDGPFPRTTTPILEALARECVRATFFLIGRSAAANPELVKRIAAEGHTVGHHTWSHPNLMRIPHAAAVEDIDRGIAADEMALHGSAGSVPTTPFFRCPYFESTPELLDLLQSRGLVVFGTDLWASDWDQMTPQQELKLITDRLRAAGKGIILFHDSKARTAAMLPDFLRYLRDNDYRVVHVVGPSPQKENNPDGVHSAQQ